MTQNKTLTDEAFEKWFGETYKDLQFNKAGMIDAWQAAKQETAKEIAELKNRLNAANELFPAMNQTSNRLIVENAELQASNNRLREDLRGIKSFAIKYSDKNNDIDYLKAFMKVINNSEKALSATAKQSLIEHDNEVLERAAKVCADEGKNLLADKIRALKA